MLVPLLFRHGLKRHLLLGAAFFSLTICCGSAQPPFLAVESTPYDHQMERVVPTLALASAPVIAPISLPDLNRWLARLHDVPYRYSRYWRTPRELRVARQGDCKGKAVALYEIMRNRGARHLCLVIGKRHLLDTQTHAWVEWQTAKGTFLLDPTFNWQIARVQEQSEYTYIPFYAYDGAHKFRTTLAPVWPEPKMIAVSPATNKK